MGRGRIKSSRTAESREKPLMRGDDARDAFGLGLGLPYIAFVAAADDDPVGAREHISGIAGEGVLDFGLGDQDGELAPERYQFGVAEQVGPAEPGAFVNEAFGAGRDS